ncbi:MAG: type II toxin-antitoxin system Phd/YefM family antitoxin [Fibrobacteres bacterium]|nr:type II toxin-antitoxin system Phd/YefM family antitoxin [Fibrobacterota bacterium]
MISTAFTEFRKHTAAYLDKVENGDTVVITRHGRPIAEVVAPTDSGSKSWKRKAIRLNIKGASLSKVLLAERSKNSK